MNSLKISLSQLDLIGNTPLLKLEKFAKGLKLFAKLENKNPLGSVKDRAALGMILAAENQGLLKKKSKIVEPTSGNTGIALAWISKIKGYEVILTMPETMSIERVKIMKFLGAKVVLTKAEKGMQGAIDKANDIAKKENALFLNQFSNPGNSGIHYKTTGPEIWEQMDKKIDIAVFCVGTGGTLTGCAKFLKKQNPKIKIVAVEPADSAVLSGNKAGNHQIQGIGAGFIPDILDLNLIDEICLVSNEEALDTAQELVLTEGCFMGISSGAAAFVAKRQAENNKNKKVCTLFPDTAERYLSTKLFG